MVDEISNKIPPQAIEAEKSLLGCLLIDKEAILKVADFLTPEDFYRGIHQTIYNACLELFQKGEPIDILTVSNKLEEKKLLEEVGGRTYLTELINCASTPSNIVHYAEIIHKKRVLRDLISASQDIGQMAFNESEDINKILDRAERRIFSIAQKSLTQRFVPVKELLGEAFERIDNLSKQGFSLRGIATGFRGLDNILAGFQKSDLIILAARPTMGKSAFAATIALNVAIKEKIPVGIFSLEMSKDQIVDRFISILSGIDLWRLRTGRLSGQKEDNDFVKIQKSMSILAETPIYIDDAANPTVLQMKAMCRRLQAEKGLGLVIVDYLQLIEPLNKDASPVQQVSESSKALKALARELQVPVLAISQLSRAVEHRSPPIPKLADLRQSGTIEQDADVVLFIYREDRYFPDTPRKGIADIIIAKHRNGPVGTVELFFDERSVSFKDLDKEIDIFEE
jgi:replicative DNA helicase